MLLVECVAGRLPMRIGAPVRTPSGDPHVVRPRADGLLVRSGDRPEGIAGSTREVVRRRTECILSAFGNPAVAVAALAKWAVAAGAHRDVEGHAFQATRRARIVLPFVTFHLLQ